MILFKHFIYPNTCAKTHQPIGTIDPHRETLKDEHTLLVQSSTVTQETAVTQRQLLERTIERLRGELKTAQKDRDVMRQNRDSAKTEVPMSVDNIS